MPYKLKNILRELIKEQDDNERERQKARELSELINSGKYRNENPVLVRGEKHVKPEFFMVRKIRKNRKPRDTSSLIDSLVEAVRETQYSHILSRKKAKFALAAKNKSEIPKFAGYAKDYGTPHIVFCEKTAPIFSHAVDTYRYFGSLDRKLDNTKNLAHLVNTAENTDEFIERYPQLYDFADLISQPNVPEAAIEQLFETEIYAIQGQINSFLDDNWDQKENYDVGAQITAVKQLRHIFNRIQEYFINGNEKITAGDREVLFGGDSYLVVNLDFFMRNFDYYDGRYVYIWDLQDDEI